MITTVQDSKNIIKFCEETLHISDTDGKTISNVVQPLSSMKRANTQNAPRNNVE